MQDNRPQRTFNLLSEFKTRLIGVPAPGASKEPNLGFTVNAKGYINLNVFTNIDGDRAKGKIQAKADPEMVMVLRELIKAAAAAKGGFKRTLVHTDIIPIGYDKELNKPKMSEKPMEVMRLVIEKVAGDNDIRLVVKTYKRPDLEFPFRPMDWHRLVDNATGEELPVGEIAALYAEGYADRLRDMVIGSLPDDYQLRYYTKPDQETVDNKASNLIISSIANNPRVTLFGNVASDQHNDGGRIYGRIDFGTMWAFAAKLQTAYRLEPGRTIGWKNYGAGKDANGRRGERKHETTLVIGKDTNGVIFQALVSAEPGRPNIKFPFELGRTWSLLDENDQPMSADKVSILVAIASAPLIQTIVTRHLIANYTPPVWNPETERYEYHGTNRNPPPAPNTRPSTPNYNTPAPSAPAPAVPAPTDIDYDNDIPF